MSKTLVPASETEASAMIRDCFEAGGAVELAGGSTKGGLFSAASEVNAVSSRGLTGITAYNPAELVMTAKAGTPLAEVEAALAENNQRLVFEPMTYEMLSSAGGEPTIGAVAAMNNSGPRRFVAGAARDSLLGVRFVNGRGEIIKNGGRVMKNVTGLDLVKLMAGSWGTLGFLTEVTFKVLPVTETEATLALRGLDDEPAANALAHAMASTVEVSGAAHLPEMIASRVIDGELGSSAATLVRIEGFADSVATRIDNLKALFKEVAELQVLEQARSRDLWRDIREVRPFFGNDNPLWRISTAPSRGHEIALALRTKVPGEVYYDWQGGLVWLQIHDGVYDDVVRATLGRHGGGHATLVRADDAVRAAIPVFQPLSPAVEALQARVKSAFDPKGLFNRGSLGSRAA